MLRSLSRATVAGGLMIATFAIVAGLPSAVLMAGFIQRDGLWAFVEGPNFNGLFQVFGICIGGVAAGVLMMLVGQCALAVRDIAMHTHRTAYRPAATIEPSEQRD
ncbi:MAG: hypothetical protein AAF663_05555 [Planctomycetota bacterium]